MVDSSQSELLMLLLLPPTTTTPPLLLLVELVELSRLWCAVFTHRFVLTISVKPMAF